MRKVRLKVEALEVEAFTVGSESARGTALAHGLSEGDAYDSGCGPCSVQATCVGTCPATCGNTCDRTCRTTCDTSLYPLCPC